MIKIGKHIIWQRNNFGVEYGEYYDVLQNQIEYQATVKEGSRDRIVYLKRPYWWFWKPVNYFRLKWYNFWRGFLHGATALSYCRKYVRYKRSGFEKMGISFKNFQY